MTFQLKESLFKTRERFLKKKKKKENSFPLKAGANCHPDTAKPKPENNFARFIYHLLNFERQILPLPPPRTLKGHLLPLSLNHLTQINSPTTQSKNIRAN